MNSQQAISKFKSCFEKLSYSHDYSAVFTSFLDFALWRLAPYSACQMKDELNILDKMYKPDMAPVMNQMFESWTIATDNDGAGFYDVLGDLFMDCVSHGRNGQFFTPQCICDMMAQMTYGQDLEEGKTVCDPACGSGRMLLAVGKMQRKLKFYGADSDHTCAKMAALNLLVNSMPGEIAWMNSLSMDHYKSYFITLYLAGTHYLPMLKITGRDETNMKIRMQKTMEKMKEAEPIPEANPEPVRKIGKMQLELF